MNGYIKISRKMLEWGWYKDTNTKAVFLHLLLMANFRDAEFLGVTVKRGEVATSIKHLAEETNLSIKNVRTAINHLKATSEVASRNYGKFQVFAILNYAKYQDVVASEVANEWQTSGKEVANKWQQRKKERKKESKNIYYSAENLNKNMTAFELVTGRKYEADA